MARRNNKATVLLIVLGFVAFIVAIIIEIVIDNIIVIGAIAGIVLLIFGIIKFIKRQDLKKQKQLNIHNAIIKG
jgi:cytochrome c biogenesis protein CcdA